MSKTTFIPTVLISILLFTTSNLKIGQYTKIVFNALLYPLTGFLHYYESLYQTKLVFVKNLPNLNKQNREQKVFISYLIRENENLKQSLHDANIQNNFKDNYQKVIPIKISGFQNKLAATTTQNISEIKSGMPIITGNILLGLITQVNQSSLEVISLENEQLPPISLKSASGPEGSFKYINGVPQIINVPSQTPLILGDFVLTNPNDLIPANLLVGKISKIITTPQDPLQKAELTLYETLENKPEETVVVVQQ